MSELKVAQNDIDTFKAYINGCMDKVAFGNTDWNRSYALAINALEKQIPKNVIWKFIRKDKGTNNYECFCPFCNKKLSPYEHHCICGQALIWSKEN